VRSRARQPGPARARPSGRGSRSRAGSAARDSSYSLPGVGAPPVRSLGPRGPAGLRGRAHDEGVRDREGFDGRDRAPSGAARGDHHSAIQLHATGRDETPRRPARSAPYGPDGQNGRSNTARAVQALIRSPRFSVPALFCDCSCTVLGRDRFAHS